MYKNEGPPCQRITGLDGLLSIGRRIQRDRAHIERYQPPLTLRRDMLEPDLAYDSVRSTWTVTRVAEVTVLRERETERPWPRAIPRQWQWLWRGNPLGRSIHLHNTLASFLNIKANHLNETFKSIATEQRGIIYKNQEYKKSLKLRYFMMKRYRISSVYWNTGWIYDKLVIKLSGQIIYWQIISI
jgi:hypothetical protein